MTQATTNLPALLNQLPVVKSQQELSTALERLKKDFNVLVPQQMNFSSTLHKVALEAVYIDPTVDHQKNGVDIYSPEGGDRYTLHYKAANKIAGAAGINWTKSYVNNRQTGQDGRVIYVEHVVEWEVKRPNGSIRKGSTTGFYRFEEDKVKFKSEKQQQSRRRFAEALAESNAKLRAIYEALEQLPRAFTLDEIRKPFLVPCVIEDINELAKDDPEIRKMIVAHSLGIIDQVYGPRAVEPQRDPRNISDRATIAVEEQAPASATSPGTGTLNATASTGSFTEAEYREAWKQKSTDDREGELKRLLKAKGQEFPKGHTFGLLSYDKQVDALVYYHSLPDVEQKAPQDSLPWEGK